MLTHWGFLGNNYLTKLTSRSILKFIMSTPEILPPDHFRKIGTTNLHSAAEWRRLHNLYKRIREANAENSSKKPQVPQGITVSKK